MKILPFSERNLPCARCGTNKSVKYISNGKHYCNACILTILGEIRKSERKNKNNIFRE
jgi:late competence protein required for DNA uptake (superfamily II DNA/RNA helicase)